MNQLYLIPLVLMACFGLVLVAGIAMIALVVTVNRRTRAMEALYERTANAVTRYAGPTSRPVTWLAVRSQNLPSVQRALGMSCPKPCRWTAGLAGRCKWLIAPPTGGWILVAGAALPDPAQDVDQCFRFLLKLSRQLGHVQFFHAEPFSRHHAWARLDEGCVTRAFAWAGETIWNQGRKTRAEIELGLECPEYGHDPEASDWTEAGPPVLNLDKVPALAARWSLDPAHIQARLMDCAEGVAESMRPAG